MIYRDDGEAALPLLGERIKFRAELEELASAAQVPLEDLLCAELGFAVADESCGLTVLSFDMML